MAHLGFLLRSQGGSSQKAANSVHPHNIKVQPRALVVTVAMGSNDNLVVTLQTYTSELTASPDKLSNTVTMWLLFSNNENRPDISLS